MAGIELSISAAAAEFQLDRGTVRKRINLAGLKPTGEKGGYPVFALLDLIPALTGGASQDLDRMSAFERKAWISSERDRLKLLAEQGHLTATEDAATEFAQGFQLITQALETLGDRLERDCGLTVTQLEYVETVLDKLREEMYRAQIARGATA